MCFPHSAVSLLAEKHKSKTEWREEDGEDCSHHFINIFEFYYLAQRSLRLCHRDWVYAGLILKLIVKYRDWDGIRRDYGEEERLGRRGRDGMGERKEERKEGREEMSKRFMKELIC